MLRVGLTVRGAIRHVAGGASTRQASSSSGDSLQHTVLYDFHIAHGGKMVGFAGYAMPVQYGSVGIGASHKTVRNGCGLFDVSHMMQWRLWGAERVKFLERLVVADLEGLAENTGTLSLLTNPDGGIVDDLIISRTSQSHLYVVSNAGCRDKDLAHLRAHLADFKAEGGDVHMELITDHGLVALQGPTAAATLEPLVDGTLDDLYFMHTRPMVVAGTPCRVTRCGYTGEDGFEISIPKGKAVELCETLVACGAEPAGLGARDSLRLEAGLCLYGNDIDDTTSPVEAGLAWTIGKRRRQTADFLGAEVILRHLKEKPARRRVGLTCSGPPPRTHCPVLGPDGSKVGEVTSGCPSPSLGVNVAMAYVPASLAKVGTELAVEVRKKTIQAIVTKMPFVKCNYYTKK